MQNNINNPPIMLLFFNRPNEFKQVFEWVRKVQPPKLFLVQDGARPNRQDDIINIEECRKIAENVDWECEVYKNYSEKNLSCDHREFTGISWCFEYVDRLIILEDDCVPDESFYPFCAELLEKYKDDERIHSVSGLNRIGKYDNGYSYNFSRSVAGWGWATWKRVWKEAEQNKDYAFLSDKNTCDYIDNTMDSNTRFVSNDLLETGRKNSEYQQKTGIIPSWEYFQWFTCCVGERLVITPNANMIKYIGVSENATHFPSDPRLLPKKIKKIFMQPAYRAEFPLKHPPFVMRDVGFEKRSIKAVRVNKYFALIDRAFKKVIYIGPKALFTSIIKRIKK